MPGCRRQEDLLPNKNLINNFSEKNRKYRGVLLPAPPDGQTTLPLPMAPENIKSINKYQKERDPAFYGGASFQKE